METTATVFRQEQQIKQKRFLGIPPYFINSEKYKYSLMEDYPAFQTKDDGKEKIEQIINTNATIKLRLYKHQGRFFIYKRN